jgi:Short coiled-coil protein
VVIKLPAAKKTHLRRSQGAKQAELHGVDENEIRRAGQWNRDACYLIEEAKQNNDKLESGNKFLQDYLSNLAQTISTTTGCEKQEIEEVTLYSRDAASPCTLADQYRIRRLRDSMMMMMFLLHSEIEQRKAFSATSLPLWLGTKSV